VRRTIFYAAHVRNDTSGEDWLEPAEVADLLGVPLRTVQESLRDEDLRAKWWETVVDGRTVKGWGVKPLTRTTRYRVRRWAVDRLADDPPED
jgi:crotonobetainyl-CoA:carnitine CoA-transferase CaiB-like acyl-CoA transferase